MKRRLVTSALPYVNNVPHLGNLIQVLSADVFSRFCRQRGYETLYVCGTDEYGTATETRAAEEGITPRELCDRFHALHCEIYDWFGIAFDKFGRTSTARHTEITQSIFLDLHANGFIRERTIEQLYCDRCSRFLADRYVRGVCPVCGYQGARGDQCESCGKLLDPTELLSPRCSVCAGSPRMRETTHLYIDLPAIRPRLESWMQEASVRGFWANNAIQMTQAWIRDGLKERAITRDLKWGIPVPLEGFGDKVFYVWFDAPIGYISITACAGDERGFSWESWWKDPEGTELFQFIGKDNIPFHTVIFPSSLLGSGRPWTMLHHMSSTEYLNYEAGKFSKSAGVGVFGNDAVESGIPADVWRFYIFYNRPEKSDCMFTWSDFQEKVNSELIGNLGNLVNRTLTFALRYYGGVVPAGEPDQAFRARVRESVDEIAGKLEGAELRDAFRAIFQLSSLANKHFQDGEPWKTRTTDPGRAAALIRELLFVVRDLAILVHPYMPGVATRILGFFGEESTAAAFAWDRAGSREGELSVLRSEVLFSRLEDDGIEAFRIRYSGSQKERAARSAAGQAAASPGDSPSTSTAASPAASHAASHAAASGAAPGTANQVPTGSPAASPSAPAPGTGDAPPSSGPGADGSAGERLARLVDLRVARIVAVERHPKADRLYVETLDDGSGVPRVIVSGLVPHYSPDELLGRNIVVVDNLKPAKLRGVESRGMLLAASRTDASGVETVEVLTAPWASPGAVVTAAGHAVRQDPAAQIDADTFFSIPLRAVDGFALCGSDRLSVDGRPIELARVRDGEIG